MTENKPSQEKIIENITEEEFKKYLLEYDMQHSYTLFFETTTLYIEPSMLNRFFFITIINLSYSYYDASKKPVWLDKVMDIIHKIYHLTFNNTTLIIKETEPSEKNRWYYESKEEPHETPKRDVYFIQADIGGSIKIGVSKFPIDRLENLQPGSPFKLRILATISKGGYGKEAELHQRFKDYRLHGEWFEPTSELLEYIQSIKHKKEDP